MRIPTTKESWFVQYDKEVTLADFDDLNDSIVSLRSSLKVIDETLAYELCRDAELEIEEETGSFELNKKLGYFVSDKEKEDELRN